MSTADLLPEHDLWSAAHNVDRRKRRSVQRKLGPSSVGTCRRRAGYIRFGVPPSNVADNKRAAILGTWLHKGLLDALRKEYGAVTEIVVEDERIRGHADAYYPDTATVEDAKTKSVYVIDRVVNRGPDPADLYQVHLYGALLRAGLYRPKKGLPDGGVLAEQARGVPVDRVRLRYVCRDNGQEWVYEQPFSEAILAEASAWLQQVLDAGDVDELPRDHDGPGLSVICDNCPFRDACWPPRLDGRAPQASLIRDDQDVARALVEYDAARAAEVEAKEAKARARMLLDAAPPGVYGDLELAWSGGRPKEPVEKVDVDEMVRLFKQADLPVPTRLEGGGLTARSITVRRPKKTS